MNNKESNSILDQVPSELLQLLAEIGYAGISIGMHNETNKIFDAIMAVRPNSMQAKLAKGSSKILMFKLTEGSKIMLEILEKEPNNHMAKAMLALSLNLAKADEQATTLASEILETSDDVAANKLATDILNSHKNKKDTIDIKKLREEQTNKILHKTTTL